MTMPTKQLPSIRRFSLTLITAATLAGTVAQAQNFTANKGELLAGFRKTGGSEGSFELIVNLGNITNFEALAAGASTNISTYAPSNLSAAFSSFNNLQWSVFSSFAGSTPWAGFPASTLWYSKARSAVGTQTTPSLRSAASSQQQTRQAMVSVATGGTTISQNLGATNSNNNLRLVREPVGDSSGLSAFIGDASDPTLGNFSSTLAFSVENATPASFSSAVRSDLYQACPNNTTDPITSLTTGSAYYVGYFQLNTDGSLTFTRASAGAPPPPAPTLSIARNGNITTISFPSTNTATYTLYYTNAAGVAAPVTTWPSLGSQSGNNSTLNFQDTTGAPDRVYRVKAQ